MTYNDLLNGTFTGIIISDFVAKDGRRIGFINPTLPAVCGAVTAWKLENGTKKRSDGNIQFVFPLEGDKTQSALGNAFGLRKNMFVKFSIRCDGTGLPQAYNVQQCDATLTPTPAPMPFVPEPAETLPETTPATEAGIAAYAESDPELLLDDEDFEDQDYSEYDDYDEDSTVKRGARDWQ